MAYTQQICSKVYLWIKFSLGQCIGIFSEDDAGLLRIVREEREARSRY